MSYLQKLWEGAKDLLWAVLSIFGGGATTFFLLDYDDSGRTPTFLIGLVVLCLTIVAIVKLVGLARSFYRQPFLRAIFFTCYVFLLWTSLVIGAGRLMNQILGPGTWGGLFAIAFYIGAPIAILAIIAVTLIESPA